MLRSKMEKYSRLPFGGVTASTQSAKALRRQEGIQDGRSCALT